MSLSTEGFTLLGTLKVPSLGVGVTSSNTPLLIKAADLTTAMKASLKADWGDLRLSTDAAGNTQLPLEIVATDIAWTRLTSVAADELIHVWGNKPAAVKEIDTAPFGRNAVYADYNLFMNFGSSTPADSSGNHPTANYTGSLTSVAGPTASLPATNFADKSQVSFNNTEDGAADLHLSAWIKPNSSSIQGDIIARRSGGNWNYEWRLESLDPAILVGSSSPNDPASSLPTGAWVRLDLVISGSTISYYRDGSLTGTASVSGGRPAADYPITIGSIDTSNSGYSVLSDIALASEKQALTAADQIDIEYQNQSATGAWWIAEDAGGGGTITVNPTLGTISYSGNATTIGLFGSIDVTATLGTISYTGNNTTVGLFGVVDVTAGLGNISYTSNNTTIQVSGAIEVNPTLGAISYTSNATSVQVSGSVDVTATLGAISYTSNNTVVDLGGAITVAAGLGTINYVSNDTIVGLAGQIGINATLGTISYTSNNTIVIASNGQSIGDINTSFAGDLYGSNFKPNSITVTFRG